MIEAWAEKLAISIKNANTRETSSIAVMTYALIIVINFLIPYTSAAIIGLLTGTLLETGFSIMMLVLVRAVSGGYHFQSSALCTLVTLSVAAGAPHLPFPEDWILLATGLCFILFAIFAPANIKGYARMPEKYFPVMKILSLFIVGSNFFIQSPTLTIILLLQALSLVIPNKRR
ncbi:accessory gene regulator ArgB-like protein [Paenibacillus sp. 1P07SE]|uniref:accessory gene regulator ArgB-like protein n=1 Tax=Paenibacillus sp. 1P07SE TaxID=3132209 RepID=UPI0039A43F7A